MSHNAQAVALTCIDFRFRKALHTFFENQLGLTDVDHKADGGGVKKLLEEGPVREWIYANFDIAFSLHGVNKVILVNHQDCGAYGGSQAFGSESEEIEFQSRQLRQAAELIKSKYPDKQVEGYLAILGNEITFKKIV